MAKKSFKWNSIQGAVLAIIIVGGAIWAWTYGNENWWAAEDDVTTTTPLDSCTVIILNYAGVELENAEAHYFGYHVPDNATEASLEALTKADYTEEITRESGVKFNFAEDHIYIIEVNFTDYQSYEFIPTMAVEIVKLACVPTATSAVMLSEKLDTTINQTDEVNWDVVIRFTDADGLVNSTMGYKPFLNYTQMKSQYQVIVIDCNATTIELDDVEVTGAVGVIAISSDKIIITINETFLGEKTVGLEFDATDLGVDFEVNQVLYGFGTASSYTTLATMA